MDCGVSGVTMPAHPYRLNIVMSISHRWWMMASGVFDLKQRYAEWSLCDIKIQRERYESIRIRHLWSPLRYFDVTQWSFCAALLQVKPTYCLSAEHMANVRGEGWAHSELREPRGEQTDFHSVDVNYTFELIDQIDLSPSPTAHIHILCKQSLLIVYTLTHSIFLSKLLN